MTFEEKHPDVFELANLHDSKRYVVYDRNDRVIEAWERQADNTWRDVTLREQELQRLEREVKKMQRELDKTLEEVSDVAE